jgi:hypothetical protein
MIYILNEKLQKCKMKTKQEKQNEDEESDCESEDMDTIQKPKLSDLSDIENEDDMIIEDD